MGVITSHCIRNIFDRIGYPGNDFCSLDVGRRTRKLDVLYCFSIGFLMATSYNIGRIFDRENGLVRFLLL